MTARGHFVTLRHRATGEYRTTLAMLTDAERERTIKDCRADGSYEPDAPTEPHVAELPVSFATMASTVNVRLAAIQHHENNKASGTARVHFLLRRGLLRLKQR